MPCLKTSITKVMYESTTSLVNVVCAVSAALRDIVSLLLYLKSVLIIQQNSRYHKRYIFKRKDYYFSVNVQAICDSGLRFVNHVAIWDGSIHGSIILKIAL